MCKAVNPLLSFTPKSINELINNCKALVLPFFEAKNLNFKKNYRNFYFITDRSCLKF